MERITGYTGLRLWGQHDTRKRLARPKVDSPLCEVGQALSTVDSSDSVARQYAPRMRMKQRIKYNDVFIPIFHIGRCPFHYHSIPFHSTVTPPNSMWRVCVSREDCLPCPCAVFDSLCTGCIRQEQQQTQSESNQSGLDLIERKQSSPLT
eukprot:scaffold1110_cov182-Ochromonas_danica.AAC.9